MQSSFRPIPFLPRTLDLEKRENGTLIVRCKFPLKETEPHIPGLLHRNAAQRPQHTWIAQRRGPEQEWYRVSYGAASPWVNSATQFLLNLDRPGQTVMVLSGNSPEHGMMELAAMQARMPYSPITPAYSLAADLSRLTAMAELLEPAVIFVQNGRQFANAIRAIGQNATIVCVEEPVEGPNVYSWDSVINTAATSQVADSVAQISHDTVAKYQFTSGSTGLPKAVIVTQGMLCSAMAMTSQMIQWEGTAPETVLLDWLPWSHIAGGHAVFNGVLEDGGTLYIDDGRPTPEEFHKTLRNLREISPVRFSGMPLSYAMLAEALEQDDALGQTFFKDLRRLTYSGARMPHTVHSSLQKQAIRHTGYRIPIVSAYGSTETSAAVTYVYWPTERSGLIGLPHPGVELKLVPIKDDDRYEIRVRSAAVTPGYLKQPELTAASFDEEGFLRMGDAATFVDPQQPEEGLAFAGRVAEEFKLQSGTFVRVSALRVTCLDATAPLLRDLVITGADERYLGALAWLNLASCSEEFKLPNADFATVSQHQPVIEAIRQRLQAHNERHPASSMQIRRVLLLEEPPCLSSGEISDKGYINQRKVLDLRQEEVKKLYSNGAVPNLIEIF